MRAGRHPARDRSARKDWDRRKSEWHPISTLCPLAAAVSGQDGFAFLRDNLAQATE